MSDGPHPSWLGLLDWTRESLLRQGCDPSVNIRNEESFRAAFEHIPEVNKDNRRPKQVASVSKSTSNIRRFVERLHHVAQPELPGNLKTVVWTSTLKMVETCCKAKVTLDTILKLLNELNSVVPRFTQDLSQYQDDESVQRPLQKIFRTYIETGIAMVANITPDGSAHRFDPAAVRIRIEEAGRQFIELKASYEAELPLAHQRATEAEARRLESIEEGRNFLPNGLHNAHGNVYNINIQFDVVKHLGRGTFGDVTKLCDKATGEVYARKHIQLGEGSSEAAKIQDAENEIKIMKKLHHDHITTVCFFIKEPKAFSIMIQPAAECDLSRYLELCIEGDYPSAMVKKIYPWFGCILHALSYAHRLEIKHRDVKPGNILINGEDIFLADFGVAKDFSQDEVSTMPEFFIKGTPVYRAPEAQAEQSYGRKADIFALGCVYSEMLTVIKRTSLRDYREFRCKSGSVATETYAFRSNLPKVKKWLNQWDIPPGRKKQGDRVEELLADQILVMIEEDPIRRPTARKCVNELKAEQSLFCELHQ